ncbi:unnamed protein product, partial [Vitis vinifera]
MLEFVDLENLEKYKLYHCSCSLRKRRPLVIGPSRRTWRSHGVNSILLVDSSGLAGLTVVVEMKLIIPSILFSLPQTSKLNHIWRRLGAICPSSLF